jgi:hypothetical protein
MKISIKVTDTDQDAALKAASVMSGEAAKNYVVARTRVGKVNAGAAATIYTASEHLD